MMGKKIVKYNPAFLSDKDLIDSFVVRQADLEIVMQVIRENVTLSNQHMMIIGPRGIGKTTLALRAMAEVRKDEELNAQWYPLVFGEESYSVTSAGEFWLEALFHLGEQEKGSKWSETYNELLEESNEDRLAERALGQLLDFADSQKKRVLLVVENFNTLLGDQINDKDAAWKIRKTLQHEERIMLLATATTRFEEMDSPKEAMFELFRPLCLHTLDKAECREIWNSVTGRDLSEERVRPLQILTGGNPRLMTIISSFGKDMSFKKLMNELTRLVDDHTEYFKSHLDGLAPVERKVYLALAELWDPSLAKEVAQAARVTVSKASSFLGRLEDKGAVVVTEEKARKKWYQVSERMYNIYHLMRRRGTASRRIKAVVRFMVHFYGKDELVKAVKMIATEACDLESMCRTDHFFAYQEICSNIDDDTLEKILGGTPNSFFEMPDIPESIKVIGKSKQEIELHKKALKMLSEVERLCDESKDLKGARDLFDKAIKLKSSSCAVWCKVGILAEEKFKQYEEAEKAFRKVTVKYSKCATAWGRLGLLLHKKMGCYEEAEQVFRKVIELDKNKRGRGWASLASVLESLERYEEAEEAYRKAIDIEPDETDFWLDLGHLLYCKFNRMEEAKKACQKVLEIDCNNAYGWANLGHINYSTGEYEQAEKAYRKAVEFEPDIRKGWENLGAILHFHLHKYQEAEKVYRKAIELHPEDSMLWVMMTKLLLNEFKQPLEALSLDEKYIIANPKNYGALNEFAWSFYEYGNKEFLPQAEKWIRKAIEMEPDDGVYQHTLASILCAKGEMSEALKAMKICLDDRKVVKETVEYMIDLFVELAAGGHAKEALKVLCESPSADVLEPLVVGLRLFIGEEVSAAAEILEVGKDVKKRIEERRDEGK